MNNWLKELPEEKRQEVRRLQKLRHKAVALVMAGKYTYSYGQEIVKDCTERIERIATGVSA